MKKNLKVLFIPFEGVGHINACISLGQQLIGCDHKVIFAITNNWKGSLQKYGIEELIYKLDDNTKDESLKELSQKIVQSGNISDLSPLEKSIRRGKRYEERVDHYIKLDKVLQQLIPQTNPDIIVCDQFFTIPSVELSGIPWVWCWSAGPLYLYNIDSDIPPMASGLSIYGDKNEWKMYKDKIKESMYPPWKRYNDFVTSRGAPPLKQYMFTNGSKYLNVYGFVKELDYSDVSPLPNNYIRFDNLMRSEVEPPFEIPEPLRGRTGKLIYFSLGSMGGADLPLMKRLISILSKSNNRFIVSKGPLHEEFDVFDNMWGQRFVPQIQVLSLVDLVITHGGNNSICETLYSGKPMIVLPLFGDQYDNAQQVQDKGLGLRLDPYRCTEEQLLNAIESLINDKQLNERLKVISKRIQTDNSISKFPHILEKIIH